MPMSRESPEVRRTSAAATAAIRRRSSVSAALRSMCRGTTRATIHSHQRGHLVTAKVWTIWVLAPAGSRVMRQSLLSLTRAAVTSSVP